ncbi:hypothetical protein CDIK_4265 [Cucumispora dikerogammari]|nr:hypothetical protein CDIK_4265 [Cucumispora dikerogammari]
MIKAVQSLKVFYENMLHITCISQLYHNCAMKIRNAFPDVDFLIFSMKAPVNKNVKKQKLFKEFKQIPKPVVTRWGLWLEAVSYYSESFKPIKQIIENLKESNFHNKNVRKAFSTLKVEESILKITKNYGFLLQNIENSTKEKYTIEDAYKEINGMNLSDDFLHLKKYINDKLVKSDFLIIAENNTCVEPIEKFYFNLCPSTSISIERSFSCLQSISTNKRHFHLKT